MRLPDDEIVSRHLLVASPRMADPSFARTVVLILHHSQEGTLGLVLNRPVAPSRSPFPKSLQLKATDEPKCLRLHDGGPLPGTLMAVHKAKAFADFETQPGVFVATQRKHLNCLLKQDRYPFRLFVGHAGWAAGQLESEVQRGDWLVTSAVDSHIFEEDDDLWAHVVRHIGWSVLKSALKIKHVPSNPSWN